MVLQRIHDVRQVTRAGQHRVPLFPAASSPEQIPHVVNRAHDQTHGHRAVSDSPRLFIQAYSGEELHPPGIGVFQRKSAYREENKRDG